jgi:VWFA-related protein
MRRLLIVLLVVVPSVLLAGQQPATPSPQQPAPTFRAGTLLIVQTVTVKDKKGKPIEGLRATDFIVTEDGVAQDIAFAEYQRLDITPLGTVSLGSDRGQTGVRPPSDPGLTPLTAVGESLNAVPLPGDTRFRGKRLIVLYLDMAGMPFFDKFRVIDGVRKYLTSSMSASDMVSIVQYQQSRVRVKQDFTDDREALLRVVAEIEQTQLDLEQGIMNVEDFATAFGEDGDTFNMFTMDRRLAALQTTVTNLGPFPELKTLVYFGSGLQLNVDNVAQFRATVNAAVRSNVTLNPVDTRGLTASAPLGNATRPSPGGVGMFSGAIAQAAVRRQMTSQDTYYSLARDTGGKATFDNNDLSMGITNATQPVTGYYLLGYYTKNALKDGKFRRVKVSLAGTLGDNADLTFRPGYYGAKEWAKFNDFDKERHLEEALRLEDPITEIPMAMEINYFQLSSAEYFVPVSVRMPGSELARPRPSGEAKAVIDMIGEIKDEYGVTMRNARDKLEFKLDPAKAADVARRPIQYETGFTLLPGNYVIKVLARDQTTGRIGTYMQPFVVPNLEREKVRLPISTVVLATQRVVPAEALYTVKQKIDATVANPLVFDGLKLIPSVTRTFKTSVPLYIFLQAYERDAAAPRPIVAYATFYRDGAPVFETEPLGVDAWDAKTRALPIRLAVSPGQLPPGSYECQVTVLDPSTNRTAYWRAPVAIIK